MLCSSARWDSAHSALGTYQRHLFQQHSCLRLSLLERGACSQQGALWMETCATARSHSEQSAESSGAGRENTVVTAPGRAQAAGPPRWTPASRSHRARTVTQARGCRNGNNTETEHTDCEGTGRRDGGNKTHLGKMHAAVAKEEQFGWVAFHVDEGAKQEETWRWLIVSRPRSTDLK